MEKVERSPDQITAVMITHEHRDHIGGLRPLMRKHPIPVYMTKGTGQYLDHPTMKGIDSEQVHLIRAYQPFQVGSLSIQPFPVPHDAREPAQYLFSHRERRLAFLTDCGQVTPFIRDILGTPDALVIECNHDTLMLHNGSYATTLKRRIAGTHGHLSNEDTVEWLRTLDVERLQCLVGAHLSEENNCEELVETMLTGLEGLPMERVHIATQDQVTPWFEL